MKSGKKIKWVPKKKIKRGIITGVIWRGYD